MNCAVPAAIDIVDLRVIRRGRAVIPGLTTSIQPGQITGLLGPSGCGKTTLMRSIIGVQKVAGGTLTVLGDPAGSPPLRRRVGYVTQTPSVYGDLTLRENLRFFAAVLRADAAAIDAVLHTVDLADFADSRVDRLSGGQRSRVSLAVALLGKPEVLILDEPTEGLDPQSRSALWEELERISAAGTTMLLTTHYMEEADRLCSRLAIIDNGQIVVEGEPAELKRGVGADVVLLQFETPDGEGQLAEVRRLLEGIVEADAVTPHPAGVALAVANASAAIPVLLRRLDGDGLHISGLQMSQPTLDDVFMQYTGRSIREEAADQPIILFGA